MSMGILLLIFFHIVILLPIATSLSCYHCVSTQPGCGNSFDWRWHWSRTCEDSNDKCVKIVEQKGADEVITRSCLSGLEFLRHDIPADKYEGCRPASVDVKLAHYVNNSIKQLDIRRDYYNQVLWCFCEFDHFCNTSERVIEFHFLIVASGLLITMIYFKGNN